MVSVRCICHLYFSFVCLCVHNVCDSSIVLCVVDLKQLARITLSHNKIVGECVHIVTIDRSYCIFSGLSTFLDTYCILS